MLVWEDKLRSTGVRFLLRDFCATCGHVLGCGVASLRRFCLNRVPEPRTIDRELALLGSSVGKS